MTPHHRGAQHPLAGWRGWVAGGGVVMDYDTWIALFALALVELRPHLTAKIAQQHAIAAYDKVRRVR